MSTTACEACGAQIPPGARFCPECGAPAADAPEKQPAFAGAAQQQAPAPQPQPIPQPQPSQPQPVYQQAPPPPQQYYAQQPIQHAPPQQPAPRDASPISTIKYLLFMLAFSVPILGLVLAFMWAFGKSSGISLRNFARAQLIVWALVLIISIVAFALGGTASLDFATNF